MLAYSTKNYYNYFWSFYKAYKKSDKPGFIRVSGAEKTTLVEFWDCLKDKCFFFTMDTQAAKNKFFSFVVSFVKTHSITVWTTGLCVNYNPWKDAGMFPTHESADAYIANEQKNYILSNYESEPPTYKVEENKVGAFSVSYKLNFKKISQGA